MAWTVEFADEFDPEFDELDEQVQDALSEALILLEREGPTLGRPHADRLENSEYANMKELRFDVRKVAWRFAFAFDPVRKAIILCGGSKSGVSEKLFYRQLIKKADKRFTGHLAKRKGA